MMMKIMMMMFRLLNCSQRRSLLTVTTASNNRNLFTFCVMFLVRLHEITKQLLFTVNRVLLILMLIVNVCKDKLVSHAGGRPV
jgi:succinate-acetate transporter protein